MSLHLIRHASAGIRGGGIDEIQRPLDDTGRAQAVAIAAALADEPITAVYSSPARRCIETVEPLAEATGLTVVVHDGLLEGASPHELAATLRRLAMAGVSAALCSHGDVIPAVVGELAANGVPMAGKGCAKGSIWTLHVDQGRISAGRYSGRLR